MTNGSAADDWWHDLYRRPEQHSNSAVEPAGAPTEDRQVDAPSHLPPLPDLGPDEEDRADLDTWLHELRRDPDPTPDAPATSPRARPDPVARGQNRPPRAEKDVGPTPRRPGRRRRLAVGLILSVLVLLGAGVGTADLVFQGDAGNAAGPGAAPAGDRWSESDQKPAGAGAGGSDVQSGPVDGLGRASLDIVNDTTALSVRAVPLAEELYSVSTPRGSGVAAQVTYRDGKVQVAFRGSGESGGAKVEVLLNSSVRWELRLGGGLQQGLLDLRAARLTGLELAGRATSIEASLPRPAGTFPVRVTGGVNELVLHVSRLVPVRVRVGGGAGRVALRGKAYQNIASGELFTTPDWRDDVDRVDVNATVGVGTLTVANT